MFKDQLIEYIVKLLRKRRIRVEIRRSSHQPSIEIYGAPKGGLTPVRTIYMDETNAAFCGTNYDYANPEFPDNLINHVARFNKGYWDVG